jgi:cytidyltransferase-like protein
MQKSVVMGSFDDIRSSDIRFLEEAARLGKLHVFLWSDELVHKLEGSYPKFPLEERLYFLEAIRYVDGVHVVDHLKDRDTLPHLDDPYSMTWVFRGTNNNHAKRHFCVSNGLKFLAVNPSILKDFPNQQAVSDAKRSLRKKVMVTGCYDWFHTGHVRFFEEVSELGDLYVVAGSDENVRCLKGEGHPMFPQEERRYVVQSIRFVKQALISSGSGWMDAEPEIARIKPEIYVVNEDGDRPEKRNFCESHGIDYVVLQRKPKEGLPRRQSVDLRGF